MNNQKACPDCEILWAHIKSASAGSKELIQDNARLRKALIRILQGNDYKQARDIARAALTKEDMP